MAKNMKKGFLLYADMLEKFSRLTDEQAGKLIKHVLTYAGGVEPEIEDPLLEYAFADIKATLDRNHEKWMETVEKRRLAGLASAESRRKKKEQDSTHVKSVGAKSTHVESVEDSSTKSTDSVSDSVSDKDSDKDSDKVNEKDSANVIDEYDPFAGELDELKQLAEQRKNG